MVSLARRTPLRTACWTESLDVPTISVTRYVRSLMNAPHGSEGTHFTTLGLAAAVDRRGSGVAAVPARPARQRRRRRWTTVGRAPPEPVAPANAVPGGCPRGCPASPAGRRVGRSVLGRRPPGGGRRADPAGGSSRRSVPVRGGTPGPSRGQPGSKADQVRRQRSRRPGHAVRHVASQVQHQVPVEHVGTLGLVGAVGTGRCVGEAELGGDPVSYTHLRAHETPEHLVCRLLLEKKK